MSISQLLNGMGRALGPAFPKPSPFKGNPADWVTPKSPKIPTVPKPSGPKIPKPSTSPPPQHRPEQPGQPRPPGRGVPDTGEDTLSNPDSEPEDLPAGPDPTTDGETERTKAPNAEDEPECKKCEHCPPRQQGHLTPQPAPQKRVEQKRGYDYQHWVCPWHYYDPERSQIGEWDWLGVNFDGLHPAQCHLYEAKHGYEGFLKHDDSSAGGRPKLQDWAGNAFDKILDQARRQHTVVKPHYPKVHLTWVFSSITTKLYLYERFSDNGWVPTIDDEVRPFTKEADDEPN